MGLLLVVVAVGCGQDDARRSTAEIAVKPECAREATVSPFEASIRQTQAVRRDYNLRADRPYVVRLRRDPAARRRMSAENGNIPLTAKEEAYFTDRYRVQDEAHAVGSFVGGIAGCRAASRSKTTAAAARTSGSG